MVILLALALLGLTAVVFFYGWLRMPLPRTEGELKVEGLSEPVTIRRDAYGVPTIVATSVDDAVWAQGFVHAQDRLWQMELNRRVGAGRLSELFGKQAVAADRFLRKLGLVRHAEADLEALETDERRLLERYCEGVNSGIASLGRRLPLEFHLLRCQPAKWTKLDSLTWVQVMSMDLCANWEQELLRGRILARMGAEKASLLHLWTRGATATIPDEHAPESLLRSLLEQYEKARAYLPNGGMPGASNAWVVGGSRTQSGKPVLANDPHLVGRTPAIWYEVKLQAPDLQVEGVSFPGLPLVVIGRNQRLAWGITNSFADTQDLYIEHFQDGDSPLYETEDGWQESETLSERILVKGAGEIVEPVCLTRHGPVLIRDGDYGLALKWVNARPSHPIRTILEMNRATSAQGFREALRGWQAPSSNFVFADREGDFGFQMAGVIPHRAKGSGLVPVPGWTGEYEWDRFLEFEELPRAWNPECGFVVNANNPVVGSDYPFHLSWDYMGSVRAQRIEQVLRGSDNHGMNDSLRLQVDCHSLLGQRFVQALPNLTLETRLERTAWQYLTGWDGDGGPESQAMALYQGMLLALLRKVLEPLLGEELAAHFLGRSENPVSVMSGHTGRYTTWLVQLLEDPDRFEALEHPASLNELIKEAFQETVRDLEERLGPNPSDWRWGRLHRLQFKHALGVNRVLGALFNGPSIGVGGDTDTVFQTAVVPHRPFDAEAWCPSWRQVVDLAEMEKARTVLPTGQSGHPGSPHYMDQFSMWLAGESRSGLGGESGRVLVLSPR